MKLRDLRNSVTVRLVASCIISLAVAVIGSATAAVLESHSRIVAEMRSGSELAELVISYAMRGVQLEPDPEAAARRLAGDLDHMRHILVAYVPQGGVVPSKTEKRASRIEHPPVWFISLFEVSSIRKFYPVVANGSARGSIVVTGYADDEIAEIWGELGGECALNETAPR